MQKNAVEIWHTKLPQFFSNTESCKAKAAEQSKGLEKGNIGCSLANAFWFICHQTQSNAVMVYQ